jgi:hypothetical protein
MESGEVEVIARRHALFYCGLLKPLGDSWLQPPIKDMVCYASECDNIRAALDWAFSPLGGPTTGVVLTTRCVPVWLYLSLMVECYERTMQALRYLEIGSNTGGSLWRHLHLAFTLSASNTVGCTDIPETQRDSNAELRIFWEQCSIYSGGARVLRQISPEHFLQLVLYTGSQFNVPVENRPIGSRLLYRDRGALSEGRTHFERNACVPISYDFPGPRQPLRNCTLQSHYEWRCRPSSLPAMLVERSCSSGRRGAIPQDAGGDQSQASWTTPTLC